MGMAACQAGGLPPSRLAAGAGCHFHTNPLRFMKIKGIRLRVAETSDSIFMDFQRKVRNLHFPWNQHRFVSPGGNVLWSYRFSMPFGGCFHRNIISIVIYCSSSERFLAATRFDFCGDKRWFFNHKSFGSCTKFHLRVAQVLPIENRKLKGFELIESGQQLRTMF